MTQSGSERLVSESAADVRKADCLSTAAQISRRRRWYQFGLWTLFALTLLAALSLMGWRWAIAPYRAQANTMALIERLGGSYQSEPVAKWMRRLAGQELGDITVVNVADCERPDEYVAHLSRLPRLEILAVGGKAFGDDHLAQLAATKTLRWLILDSTSVSDEGLAAVQSENPALQVYRSQRQAIAAIRALDFPVMCGLNRNFPDIRKVLGDAFFEEGGYLESHFGELRAAQISELPTIEVLDLYGVRIPDAEMHHLSRLSKLRTLSLRDAQITDEGVRHLAGMLELHNLDLMGNSITDAGLASLERLTKLEVLCLDSKDITDAGIAHLRRMEDLRDLCLANATITDSALAHLGRLSKLDTLTLSGTRVSDAGLEHLRSLNLTWLDLPRTNVSDAAVEHLAQLGRLTNISVRRTHLTVEGVARLQNALPGCKVVSDFTTPKPKPTESRDVAKPASPVKQ